MSTKIDIINGAFEELRISGQTVTPSAPDISMALRRLESMMAQFFAQWNLNIGYNFEVNPNMNSQTNVDLSFEDMMRTSLAVRLCAAFGKEIPAALDRMAANAFSNAVSTYQAYNLQMVQPSYRMPIGNGNQYRGVFWNRFSQPLVFPPNVAQTNNIIQGERFNYSESFAAWLGTNTISSYTIVCDPLLTIVTSANASPLITYTITAPLGVTASRGPWQQVNITVTDSISRVDTRIINFAVVAPADHPERVIMAQQKLPIALLQGDRAQDITDYIDALPVNVSGVIKEILGAQGYMLKQPGLTEYGTLAVVPETHPYVTFDGSTYLEKASDLTGISDTKYGTLVFRIARSANSDDQILQNETTPPEVGIQIQISTSGILSLYSEDTGGNPVLDAVADTAFTTVGQTLNACLSWDASTAPQLYINDTLISMTVNTWTDQALDYTGTSWNVYGRSRPFGGNTNFLWFDHTAAMDFSVESNRRKFFDANGCPVDLGANGQTPTGSSPIIYLSGTSSTFATNKGTGGGFTLTGGSLTDGSESCP